jgi:flagellar basal body-associated protein FliL
MTHSFKFVLGAMAILLAASVFAGNAIAAKKGSKGRLSANQFISMQPFNIPMTPKGDEKRQFTLVVALELTDEDERDFVRARVTLIRSRTYDLLFRLIAYRTQEPLVPNTGLIKKKMLDIAHSVVGADKVASVIVQQVYHGRAP